MEEKTINCRLEKNLSYGASIRRGATGKIYKLSVNSITKIAAKDLKVLQDHKSDQYEPFLKIV